MSESRFSLYAALVAPLAVGLLVGGWMESLDQTARGRTAVHETLTRQAALAAEFVGDRTLAMEGHVALDALADRLGTQTGTHVTLLDAMGRVVGDSRVPAERVPAIESHGDRPEVQAALAGETGVAERRSDTVGVNLAYLAVPIDGGSGGALRVAVPAAPSTAGGGAPAWLLGGLAGGLIAIALGAGLARREGRALDQLRVLTHAVAAGDLDYRLPRGQRADVDEIATSIRSLAEQLRARLAETLSEKERLQAVLDGMTEAVLVIDTEGEIVLANDRLREFFGVRGDMTGRTTLEGIRNADLAELLLNAAAKPEPVTAVLELTRPLHRTLRVHAVRFPSGATEPTGTVAVFHDVTELTQLEKMRRDFVANASHELRTPLAAIRGFAETLLGSPDLAEQDRRNYLEVIDRHARRLGTLVSDLLELSRIESGKSTLSPAAVEIAPVVTALLREFGRRLDEKALTTTHELAGDAVAFADASAVEQILTNLLDNAIKYSEPGGTIHVDVRCDDHVVTVELRDTGLGIPEADLGRIFERFYRVDKARSRAAGGTGLGLAIVKHLVQSMDGEIAVESRVGAGSTFRFTLPRA